MDYQKPRVEFSPSIHYAKAMLKKFLLFPAILVFLFVIAPLFTPQKAYAQCITNPQQSQVLANTNDTILIYANNCLDPHVHYDIFSLPADEGRPGPESAYLISNHDQPANSPNSITASLNYSNYPISQTETWKIWVCAKDSYCDTDANTLGVVDITLNANPPSIDRGRQPTCAYQIGNQDVSITVDNLYPGIKYTYYFADAEGKNIDIQSFSPTTTSTTIHYTKDIQSSQNAGTYGARYLCADGFGLHRTGHNCIVLYPLSPVAPKPQVDTSCASPYYPSDDLPKIDPSGLKCKVQVNHDFTLHFTNIVPSYWYRWYWKPAFFGGVNGDDFQSPIIPNEIDKLFRIDETGTWAVCIDGYFIPKSGNTRGSGDNAFRIQANCANITVQAAKPADNESCAVLGAKPPPKCVQLNGFCTVFGEGHQSCSSYNQYYNGNFTQDTQNNNEGCGSGNVCCIPEAQQCIDDNQTCSTKPGAALCCNGTCTNKMCGASNPLPPPLTYPAVNTCPNNTCDTALGAINVKDPGSFVTFLFRTVLSIAGIVALIVIIIAGYTMLLSRGNPEKVEAAKETLTSVIVGLFFIIFALIILETLGVDILGIPGWKGTPPTPPPTQSQTP